jgi:beta-carotene 3-hydroxylase
VLPAVAVAALSFMLMEPLTYLTHRFVMHGVGARLHRSHHRPGGGAFEANDAFPLAFSGLAMVATFAAYQGWTSRLVLAVVAGVTAYGLVYALVHDVYIHGRLRLFGRRHAALDRLAAAHRLHHRFGGEPYGMLWPVVPAAVRARAAQSEPVEQPEAEPLTSLG